jgi:hypothetical protein
VAAYQVGQRVKLTAPMVNENSSWMPVEKDMPVGLEGTIRWLSLDGPREWHQISVSWDNGRSLNLIPGKDSFIVLPQEQPSVAET